MPNTSLSLSLFFFIFFHVFGGKIELQHIVVFNLYKMQLFVISAGEKTRHLWNFLIPSAGVA